MVSDMSLPHWSIPTGDLHYGSGNLELTTLRAQIARYGGDLGTRHRTCLQIRSRKHPSKVNGCEVYNRLPVRGLFVIAEIVTPASGDLCIPVLPSAHT